MTTPDPLVIAGREFRSRLILGTGKYSDEQVMVDAFDASGTEMVTVALRRVNLDDLGKGSLIDRIDQDRYLLLPNTAACYTADEAVRTARLARELGGWNWVKLEVIGDEKTLFPDNEELLAATRELVADDFVVLPYTTDDPIVCRKLEDLGAAAVMPLAAPIGSGMGIRNPANLRIIVEQANVPGHRGRRGRHRKRRRPGDGAGRGRRADEHRRRRRPGSGADGARDEAGHRGRLARRQRRPHPEEALRDGVVAGGRSDRLGGARSRPCGRPVLLAACGGSRRGRRRTQCVTPPLPRSQVTGANGIRLSASADRGSSASPRRRRSRPAWAIIAALSPQ